MRNRIICSFALLFAVAIFASTAIDAWLLQDWHNQQRAGQIALLLSATAIAIWRPLQVSGTVSFWLINALILLGAYSSWQAEYPIWAAKEFCLYAGTLILILLTSDLAKDKHFQKILLAIFIFCSTVHACMFLLYYTIAIHIGSQSIDPYLLLYGFDNPRFLGQYQTILTPILASCAYTFYSKGNKCWIALSALATIHWCIAWSLGGRGMIAALALAHISILFINRAYFRLLAWQAAVACCGLTLFIFLFFAIPDWIGIEATSRSSVRTGLSSREVIWTIAWKMFLENPIFGVGPLHFSTVWNHIAAHPHQLLLQWLAEWGLLATAILVTLIVRGLICGASHLRNQRTEPIDAALWISIVAALFLAQVDGMLVMPYPATWLTLLIGLAIARWAPQESESQEKSAVRKLHLKAIASITFVLISFTLALDLVDLAETERDFYETNDIGSPPRLWAQGWIPM